MLDFIMYVTSGFWIFVGFIIIMGLLANTLIALVESFFNFIVKLCKRNVITTNSNKNLFD